MSFVSITTVSKKSFILVRVKYTIFVLSWYMCNERAHKSARYFWSIFQKRAFFSSHAGVPDGLSMNMAIGFESGYWVTK